MNTPKIPYTNENSIFFTIARMNPPTPGHLNIIRQLIQDANKRNVTNVYVILSNTNNNNENPIPCPEKMAALEEVDDATKTMIHALKIQMMTAELDPHVKELIQQTQVHTICTPEGGNMFTPITQIIHVMSNVPQINLFVVIGADREDMVDSITNFFFKIDNVYSIAKDVLPREGMSAYKEQSKNPESLNTLLDTLDMAKVVEENGMSASFVRNIVKNNRKDKFDELYSPYLDQDKIDTLYSSIQSGLNRLGPNEKPSSKPKPLIYTYPMIKGISTFPEKAPKKVTAPKMEKVEKVSKVKAKVKAKVEDSGVYKTSRRSLYKIPSTTIPDSPSSENNQLGGSRSKRTAKKRRKKGVRTKTEKIRKTRKTGKTGKKRTKKRMKGLTGKKKRRTNK